MVTDGMCGSPYLQRGTRGEAPPTRRTIRTSTPSPSEVSQAADNTEPSQIQLELAVLYWKAYLKKYIFIYFYKVSSQEQKRQKSK